MDIPPSNRCIVPENAMIYVMSQAVNSQNQQLYRTQCAKQLKLELITQIRKLYTAEAKVYYRKYDQRLLTSSIIVSYRTPIEHPQFGSVFSWSVKADSVRWL